MCHSDVTTHTFEWSDHIRFPIANRVQERECRKWSPLVDWAKKHSPSVEDGQVLEHPFLGRCCTNVNVSKADVDFSITGLVPSTPLNKTQAV